ncbi:hypothetical protein AX15_000590 [Amanita polypyramis BW_CC]|nr:hypothetical protein AX15_000590 [Amanita polypyramis BW_CC]
MVCECRVATPGLRRRRVQIDLRDIPDENMPVWAVRLGTGIETGQRLPRYLLENQHCEEGELRFGTTFGESQYRSIEGFCSTRCDRCMCISNRQQATPQYTDMSNDNGRHNSTSSNPRNDIFYSPGTYDSDSISSDLDIQVMPLRVENQTSGMDHYPHFHSASPAPSVIPEPSGFYSYSFVGSPPNYSATYPAADNFIVPNPTAFSTDTAGNWVGGGSGQYSGSLLQASWGYNGVGPAPDAQQTHFSYGDISYAPTDPNFGAYEEGRGSVPYRSYYL